MFSALLFWEFSNVLNSKAGEYESIYALYRKTLWLRMPKLVEISHGTKNTVCPFEDFKITTVYNFFSYCTQNYIVNFSGSEAVIWTAYYINAKWSGVIRRRLHMKNPLRTMDNYLLWIKFLVLMYYGGPEESTMIH